MKGLLTVGFWACAFKFSLKDLIMLQRAITNPPLDILLAVLDFVYLPLLSEYKSHDPGYRIILKGSLM